MRKKAKRAPKRHRVSRNAGARLVRGIRRRLKLTQAAFAARLGVSQMTVCRWEAGTAPVRPVMRLALGSLQPSIDAPKAAKRGRKRAKR